MAEKRKGQIQIFAKNIKGNARGEIREDAKYIKNIAGGKHIQNGFTGGVNNGTNQPRKQTKKTIKKIIRLEITNIVTGYTIQGLKGVDYTFSDPAVIVPTYTVNILDVEEEIGGKELKCENVGNFDVTRDAWYSLGKNKDKKHVLMNRAFIPSDYRKNLYGLQWIPSYPNISARFIRSNMDAFIFTRFGNRKIPAKPLKTQKKLDGSSIDSPRKDENFATDVMIHIGDTYEMKGYDHLGGSYGCFAYIPKDDIYLNPELAEKASDNDDYDDVTSNESWKKITNKIKKLAFEAKKDLQVILNFRDENNVYFPKKILKE